MADSAADVKMFLASQKGEQNYAYVFPLQIREGKPRVLLGLLKYGSSMGKYDGFGGEIRIGETVEDCVHRALLQKAGLTPLELRRCAEVVISDEGTRSRHNVLISSVGQCAPLETDTVSSWFDIVDLPFKNMRVDLECWLPQALQDDGMQVQGYFELNTNVLTRQWVSIPCQVPGLLTGSLRRDLQSAILSGGPNFQFEVECSKDEFDYMWKLSWGLLGFTAGKRLSSGFRRVCSTVDSPNRLRDKHQVEESIGLPERGSWDTEFFDKSGTVVAKGFEAILYGDHGPYVEFAEHQICWEAFTKHVLKGPGRYHFEHYTADVSVKVYDQFKPVADQPNPPDGPFSQANNRKEGYADYKAGMLYSSCDNFVDRGCRIFSGGMCSEEAADRMNMNASVRWANTCV